MKHIFLKVKIYMTGFKENKYYIFSRIVFTNYAYFIHKTSTTYISK